jgi:hypothetical protein
MAGDATFDANFEGEFLKKNLIPLSRPIFNWGCIRVAWGLRAVSDRMLCRLLGIDRKRLRERIEREKWTRRRREWISTLRSIAANAYARGQLHAAGNIEDMAARRRVEFEIALLRCQEMIASARAAKGRQ